jgi:hypothetical protein
VIDTKAGSYPALYTKAEDGGESWTWNGIVVLEKSHSGSGDAITTHRTELVELKME